MQEAKRQQKTRYSKYEHSLWYTKKSDVKVYQCSQNLGLM